MRKKLLVFTVIFACILIAGCEGNKVSTNDQKESSPAVSEKVTEPAGDSAQQDNQGTQIPTRIIAPVGDGIAYDFPFEPPAHKK